MRAFHKDPLLPIAVFVLILFLLSLGCSSSSPMQSTATPLALPSDKLGGDEEVLPQFIVDAVQAAMPGATLVAATREEESGEIAYEVLVQNEDGIFEVDVSMDGVVQEIEPAADDERAIRAADLPEAVLLTIEATVPGGRITEVVRESIRGAVVYDVEVDVRGEKFDLEIAPDGTLLKVEEGN